MLLPPRKHPLLQRVFAWYGRRLLRAAFARVSVGGTPWPAGGPSIALVNHSAWWDPIVALFLSHDLFRRDGYGIMEGAQRERYPFLRRVGCFAITSSSLATSPRDSPLADAECGRHAVAGSDRRDRRQVRWLLQELHGAEATGRESVLLLGPGGEGDDRGIR